MTELEQYTSPLTRLSEVVGAPEAALRLLFSILLGIPIALVHRYTLYGRNPVRQHLFFITCGIVLGYWNYGWSIVHSANALCVTYLLLVGLGGTVVSVLATFIFNMTYLLCGYYITSTEDYDIKWTMPQCVLTLRLIGLAFNFWDAQKPEGQLSEYQKQVALKERPSFLEMAAFIYFPGSFLIGPQFSMKRYLDYVGGSLNESKSELPDCLAPGILRAVLGFIYVALYQLGILYVSDQYLLAPEFEQQNFFKRLLLVGFWGHVNLYKYISCWLITEGVCTTFGITYNGKDAEGRIQWNGCENVKLLTFEQATRFYHFIISFNINTNNWCAEYIYKRLRFLGSKIWSQVITLSFLAIWHGFHSGYYHCFLMEFLVTYAERDVVQMLERSEKVQTLLKNHIELRIVSWILLKMYTFVFMGYCLVSFVLLSYPRYVSVFSSLRYCGHIVFLSYPILSIVLKRLLRQKPKKRTE